ncbi:(d)CMP kinase [Lewinella sp. W8]|uniref:(d)CMP kinase n=1 Tax=Lewinella sp. W8 TaxID=2528208 RepID=UPI00106809D1|nr:(d)CMP kinase [Lewinella sp. W8]MTB49516.1 (d)CMP kinase [Lewinella sp. W8]
MRNTPRYTIAIDGYSACGKSTLARAMARRLGYRYVDTGAMYRMVTLQFLRDGVDIEDDGAVAGAVESLEVDFTPGTNRALLCGEDVEEEIRGLAVSNFVSPVAALPRVRAAMRTLQRQWGADGGVVMDGRDIGTVIFPNADLKIFVTADLETRVDRRLAELTSAGRSATREAVKQNLLERDHIDSTRDDSPLRQAEDAVELDNSELSLEAFIDEGMRLVAELEEK